MPARRRSRETPAPLELPDLAAAIATHLPGEWTARPAGNPLYHSLAQDGGPTLLLCRSAVGTVAIEAMSPTAPAGVPVTARTGRTVGEFATAANDPKALAARITAELLPAYHAAANNLHRDVKTWRDRQAVVTRTAATLAAVPGVERWHGSTDDAPILTASVPSSGPEPVDVQLSVVAPHGAASVRIVADHLTGEQARRVLQALGLPESA